MMSRRYINICITLALQCALLVTYTDTAHAQKDSPGAAPSGVDSLAGGADRPWAEGVTMEHQNKAREMFYEANALILEQFFKEAAERYREALDHWDHPAIHFNMSLALMNLDRPIELYHALRKSMEHGIPPLIDETNYKRAENYLNLVSRQIAHIVVVCEFEGARVTLDGKLLFIGPGQYEGVTLAGEHTVAASKPGYLDNSRQVVVSAGTHKQITMRLYTLDDLTYERRMFASWLPWTVAGSGILAAGLGALLHMNAKNSFTSFDTEFGNLCTLPDSCPDGSFPDLDNRLDNAVLGQRIGVSAYAVGGALLISGMAMILLNRPERIRRESPGEDLEASTIIAPVLSDGVAGLAVVGTF